MVSVVHCAYISKELSNTKKKKLQQTGLGNESAFANNVRHASWDMLEVLRGFKSLFADGEGDCAVMKIEIMRLSMRCIFLVDLNVNALSMEKIACFILDN